MLVLLEWSSSLTGATGNPTSLSKQLSVQNRLWMLPTLMVPAAGQRRMINFRPLRAKAITLMRDKLYLIRFKGSDVSIHVVIAARAEIHGEHVVFLGGDGTLAALLVLEIVESWSEFELYNA
jgi:hypothetical protein